MFCRFDDDFKIIKRKGTVVVFGIASGPIGPVKLLKLMEKNVTLVCPSWVLYVSTFFLWTHRRPYHVDKGS